MATIDPPDSVPNPAEQEVKEALERSDGRMPDGVTRLPNNRVEYWSQEHLMRLDVLHVDVTSVSPSGVIGSTRSFPIDGVRYIETRGFCAREDDSHTWGYVGYYDASGHPRSLSGYLLSKVKPGTNGFPTLPDVVATAARDRQHAEEVTADSKRRAELAANRETTDERTERVTERMFRRQKQQDLMAAYGGTVSHEEVGRDLDRETERHVEGLKNDPALSDLSPTDRVALARLLVDMDAQEEADAAAGPSLPQGTFAAQVLETVTTRGSAYGHPSINHQLTADLWSAWFSRKTGLDVKFTPEDVITLQILQKISRLGEISKDDTVLDILGYAENISMLLPHQRNL